MDSWAQTYAAAAAAAAADTRRKCVLACNCAACNLAGRDRNARRERSGRYLTGRHLRAPEMRGWLIIIGPVRLVNSACIAASCTYTHAARQRL
jgi:hypothetical protein